MLLPKGTASGLRSQLFVMVSNYEEDRVNQDLVGTCNDAAAFCGIRDRLYPDKKPMGYPFDRNARANARSLSDFITPNMRAQDVSIVFNDRTVERPRTGGRF
jgi:tyrosinase